MSAEDSSARPLISSTPAWQALSDHARVMARVSLGELFARDPLRGERFAASAGPLYFDYAKDHVTEDTLDLLLDLACGADLAGAIDELFKGSRVNSTENRPALHVALRSSNNTGDRFQQEANGTLLRCLSFANRVRNGEVKGSSGQPFDHIVNLGIGGSDLGPRLIVNAFPALAQPGLNCAFVANIDSDELAAALAECKPESTLVIVSSKSFSTLETLTNAKAAIAWLRAGGIDEQNIAAHLVAITGKFEHARALGVEMDHIFDVPDWVGGRYSLWSAIGLPIAITLGTEVFLQLLEGAREMDRHFRSADLRNNLPVIHGLQAIWHINFRGYRSRAVLPYVHHLRELPAYLQQLTMESLGKSTTKRGVKTDYSTGQIIWGSEGTNGQHSFHQWLLQGSEAASVDFIATRQAHCQNENHLQLLANCLAQSRALMTGKPARQILDELIAQGLDQADAKILAPHKAVSGNRPSNTLMLDQFSPRALGALLAFFEHSVYVQSVIWDINAFDQWGVELGKTLYDHLRPLLNHNSLELGEKDDLDSSTRALLNYLGSARDDDAAS